jgi:CRISPR/Cas system-associated exonuclease Cas4 (RecB family)
VSTHAKLSPSGSSRWLACPGSIWLTEKAPAQKSSAAADEGTDAHEWAAKILLNMEQRENPYRDVEMYVNRVRASADRKDAQLWIEQRVYVNDVIHGTPDAVVSHKSTLEVFDLKYGYNKVEASGNTQLIIYAAGAIKTYGLNPRKVVLHIVQPRAGGIRSATLPRKTFDALVNSIVAAADALLKNPDAPRKAGEHCQYCPAASICPERKAEAHVAAQMAFRPVEDLDEDTLIWAIENRKRVADWFDQLVEAAIAKPPRGYIAIQGQGRRVWRNDVEIPLVLKAMTLAEAEKAGYLLDELTVKKAGPLTLVRKDVDASSFPDL